MSGTDVNLTNLAPPGRPDGEFNRTLISAICLGALISGAGVNSGRLATRQFCVQRAILCADELIAGLLGPPPVSSDDSIL